jgi:hypothetical protein
MNLISLPNELIYVVVELFLDTLGDIVVIRQVCRVLRDVCDGALPSLETEMAVGFNGEDIALAMGNNGPQKIFSPGMVEYRVELEKCGFNYIDITNGNVGLGRRIQPCQISDIDQSGIGFWLLHVRKLNLHGIDSDRHGWSRLIEFFDYLEHKKRTSQLHVTFCEHGLMAYSQGRVVNSPEVRKVVNKINNSSLNLSVDFQISFFENLKQKLYLGPKFSKCVIYYSAIESERLCDVAILLPHHNVSLKIGDQLNPRVQNMQIITEFCGRNIRSLKLAQIEVDANGVLDDLNVDEVIFEGVTWFNRPSNKPTCSASVVKLVTSNLVEFEIFNFTRIKQLHWKSDFDPPLLPAPLHLKKRIMELDLLNVDWYHDLFYESVSLCHAQTYNPTQPNEAPGNNHQHGFRELHSHRHGPIRNHFNHLLTMEACA